MSVGTIRVETIRGDCQRVERAETDLRLARIVRDESIRAALADGAPYATLQDATGLSRGQLDAIRRGKRRR